MVILSIRKFTLKPVIVTKLILSWLTLKLACSLLMNRISDFISELKSVQTLSTWSFLLIQCQILSIAHSRKKKMIKPVWQLEINHILCYQNISFSICELGCFVKLLQIPCWRPGSENNCSISLRNRQPWRSFTCRGFGSVTYPMIAEIFVCFRLPPHIFLSLKLDRTIEAVS